ncbi:MAG: hypothetical protein EOP86_07850 [Verrucomicrobiaceae bacterium]|nr:MAG: hypothetical protein EOP86_07850 [Verrucomicrobiaceae bacterium]
MRFTSLLIVSGATAAGVAMGRFSLPAKSVLRPSAGASAEAVKTPQPAVETSPAGMGKPDEELVTAGDAMAYMAKLEKLSALEVIQELRLLSWQDTLRNEIVQARFLQFPATERLRALLEPPPAGAIGNIGGWSGLYLKTAADMILTDPAGVAKLLNDEAIGGLHGIGPVLEPLLARDGWEASLAFLDKLPPKGQAEAKPALTALLAARDLPKAQGECLKVPEGKDRNLLIGAVARFMADTDPKAALEWADRHFKPLEHTMGHRPQNAAADILNQVMAKDPAKAASLLAENQSAFSGNYGGTEVGEIFSTWAAKDFKAARAWLNANPLGDDLQTTAIRSIHTQQLQSLKEDGAALSFYRSLSPDLQADCAATLLSKVGAKGLPGGLDSFYQALPQRGRSLFESGLRFQMPNLSTEERKQALVIIGKSAENAQYMLGSALEMVPQEERADLLASLSGPMRDELQVKQARNALQTGDFEKAKTLLEGMSDGISDVLPHSEVAVALADTDPAAAAAWVAALPEGKARSAAVANLAANWVKADPAAATEWARNLTSESGRDEALQEIIKIQGLTGEVSSAIELASGIRDEPARLNALAAATRTAWFQDQTVTRQLLSGQNLTPEQTRKVIDRIETGNQR